MTIIPREIVQFKTAYVFPRFYGSDLSCFNVHAPTYPRDTIICLPDDNIAENINLIKIWSLIAPGFVCAT